MADHPRPPAGPPAPGPGLRGAVLVLGGAVLWGTTGTAQALGPAGATPLAVGATRLVAGGALLVLLVVVQRSSVVVGVMGRRRTSGAGRRGGGVVAPLRDSRSPRRQGIAPGVVGAVGVAAYQVSFFAAVEASGVALGTAVAIGSAPVMTGLIEWATGGGRPTPRWWGATTVAAVGVAVLAGPSALAPAGVVLALVAGASYAVYAVASKRLLDTGLDSPTAMAVVFGGGGLLLLPVLAVADLSWVATAAGALVLAWLAIATILFAYLLFGAGLRLVPASMAATLSLAEPLTAAVLGIALLGERPSAVGLVGAVIIFLGLVVLLTRPRRAPGTVTRMSTGSQSDGNGDGTSAAANPLDVLRERGFVQDTTDEDGLRAAFDAGPVTFYYGMDPTAPSLHIGNLIGLMAMSWMQRLGHRPIALAGGGTGRIGDPSGRDTERQLLDEATLRANLAGIREQAGRFVDLDRGLLVDNHDWLGQLNLMDFLRDVGKVVSVNQMVAREAVKRRLESRDQGLSFTEFCYQLLQAYDYAHLHAVEGCRLQIGGSDQWGNITAGTELVRRLHAGQAFGLVWPLLTTASGAKFGKSAGNAIWLDPALSSPYAYLQYWINAADADVEGWLKLFTYLPLDEVAAVMAVHAEAPHERLAQRRLAAEATRIVHGEAGLAEAQRATEVLFGDEPFDGLSDAVLTDAFASAPSVDLPADAVGALTVAELMTSAGAARSGGEARRLVDQGGVRLNNVVVDDATRPLAATDLATATTLVLRVGKKRYFLGRLAT